MSDFLPLANDGAEVWDKLDSGEGFYNILTGEYAILLDEKKKIFLYGLDDTNLLHNYVQEHEFNSFSFETVAPMGYCSWLKAHSTRAELVYETATLEFTGATDIPILKDDLVLKIINQEGWGSDSFKRIECAYRFEKEFRWNNVFEVISPSDIAWAVSFEAQGNGEFSASAFPVTLHNDYGHRSLLLGDDSLFLPRETARSHAKLLATEITVPTKASSELTQTIAKYEMDALIRGYLEPHSNWKYKLVMLDNESGFVFSNDCICLEVETPLGHTSYPTIIFAQAHNSDKNGIWIQDGERVPFELNENLKNWYNRTYSDSLGDYINPDLTISDTIDKLALGGAFYDQIGVHDSVVRERIFEKIANVLMKSYDDVYESWLNMKTLEKTIPAFSYIGDIKISENDNLGFELAKLIYDHSEQSSVQLKEFVDVIERNSAESVPATLISLTRKEDLNRE